MKKSLLHNSIVKILLYFLLSFALILPLWLQVNTAYNHLINNITFHITAMKYDFNVVKTKVDNNQIVFTINNAIPIKDFNNNVRVIDADIVLDTSSVTFNVPMTLSLLIALTLSFPGRAKDKIALISKSMTLLLILHVMTILIIAVSALVHSTSSSQLLHFYLNRFYLPQEFIFNFASLLNNYAARFEPFLLAIFTWWMLQLKKEDEDEIAALRSQ